ncbi:MAG: hypothetical protein IJ255_02625 [Bacteroidales bacterium]|nr:hypothetical protein [Bacteroidales bacterium]
MNKYFDFKRFGKYLAYDLRNLRANYGLTLLILGCFPLFFYVINIIFNVIYHGFLGEWAGWSSPGFPARVSMFFVCLLVLVVSFPVQQYGKLTEKRYGSDWLMIPASRLEKFLSMLTVSLLVVPLAYLVSFNLTDWILSLLDPTYGQALVTWNINEAMYGNAGAVVVNGVVADDMPVTLGGGGLWLLWSSIIEGIFIFLLGALCFQRRKVAKTILCLIGLSIILSSVLSFIAFHHMDLDAYFDSLDPERMQNLNWNFRINLALWMHWLIVLGGLGTAIWFRLKTLKH